VALKTTIVDAYGNSFSARVTNHGELVTTFGNPLIPEKGEPNHVQFFSQKVSSAGDGTGTVNLNVNGAVTPQVFSVNALNDRDIHIMKLVIVVIGTTVTHKTFGSLAALTNGVDVAAVESGKETAFISKAKNFADLIRQTAAERPFGDAATAFELQDVNAGNDDMQLLPMDIGALMPGGLRLGRQSVDKLIVRVNDDLTTLIEFAVRAMGYYRVPDEEAEEI
jgi:hypothetical protein